MINLDADDSLGCFTLLMDGSEGYPRSLSAKMLNATRFSVFKLIVATLFAGALSSTNQPVRAFAATDCMAAGVFRSSDAGHFVDARSLKGMCECRADRVQKGLDPDPCGNYRTVDRYKVLKYFEWND